MNDTIIEKITLSNNEVEELELNDELIDKISRFNTYLSPSEVLECLNKGGTIHSSFSTYRMKSSEKTTVEVLKQQVVSLENYIVDLDPEFDKYKQYFELIFESISLLEEAK